MLEETDVNAYSLYVGVPTIYPKVFAIIVALSVIQYSFILLETGLDVHFLV